MNLKMNTGNFLLWNARGYKDKKEELTKRFNDMCIDIAVITELKNKIFNTNDTNNNTQFLKITGYKCITDNKHIDGRAAGGVAIFMRSNTPAKMINLDGTRVRNMDCAAAMVKGFNENLGVIGVCRRPTGRLKTGEIKRLINCVKRACTKEFGKKFSIILAGDFNEIGRAHV